MSRRPEPPPPLASLWAALRSLAFVFGSAMVLALVLGAVL